MPNWRTDLAYPAGHSQVGGVELVHRARTALTSVRPDLCLYLEAASPLFRSASEVTYPNDETWLPAVLAEEEISAYGRPLVGGRVRGTDVATWLSRCELLYPSVTRGRTVHHISSHDTVWWSPLGKKWCTERYGRSLTVAMYAVLSLIEGSFMVFTGDERGVEDELDRFLELRNQLPELAVGACRFGAFSSDEAVFTAVREHGDRRSIVAVNLSDEAVETTLDGSEAFLPNGSPIVIYDALGRTYHRTSEGAVVHRHSPGDLSVAFAAWEPRLFVVRRASDVADIGRDFDAP